MEKECTEGRISIKCVCACCVPFFYRVQIKNTAKELVFEALTKKQTVAFFPKKQDWYEICIRPCGAEKPTAAYRWVLACPNRKAQLYFIFSAAARPTHLYNCTFMLTDKHYDGLPIVKGEIFLWEDLIR